LARLSHTTIVATLAFALSPLQPSAEELTKEKSLAIERAKEPASPVPRSPSQGGSDASAVLREAPGLLSESEPNDVPADADLVPQDVSLILGAINRAEDVDYFVLSVASGARGFFSVDATDGTLANGDSYLEVRAPDGVSILEADDDDGPRNLSSGIAGLQFPSAGLYYLRVKTLGSSLDPYVLTVSVHAGAAQAEVEPNDTPFEANAALGLVSGRLTPADADSFSFSALVGDLIMVGVDPDPNRSGSSMDPLLELFDPSGNLVVEQDLNAAGQPEFINLSGAPEDGVYSVRVRSPENGTGDYLLSLRVQSLEVPAELIEFEAAAG
jgi:hypothetical protein